MAFQKKIQPEEGATSAAKPAKSNAPTDKSYKLIGKHTRLSYTLASRHSKSSPLLYYDAKKNINREMRYCSNQNSPFVDEQTGTFLLDWVVFENGYLFVPKENPGLQAFLYYHPQLGKVFEEINPEKDANIQLDKMNIEIEAAVLARGLTVTQQESIFRVLFNRDPSTVDSATLKRDVLIFAKKDPVRFIEHVNDPALELDASVRSFFDKKLLAFRNNNKSVAFNLPHNNTIMVEIPFGAEPYQVVAAYLQSDDGIEHLKMLETESENR